MKKGQPPQSPKFCYLRRAINVTRAAKLMLTYGKYHLAMLHRQLTMNEGLI